MWQPHRHTHTRAFVCKSNNHNIDIDMYISHTHHCVMCWCCMWRNIDFLFLVQTCDSNQFVCVLFQCLVFFFSSIWFCVFFSSVQSVMTEHDNIVRLWILLQFFLYLSSILSSDSVHAMFNNNHLCKYINKYTFNIYIYIYIYGCTIIIIY